MLSGGETATVGNLARRQNPCRRRGRRATGWLALALAFALPRFAAADAVPIPELPQPEKAPIFIAPTPIGDLEYRAGRGLRLGDTGFTLGGFGTVEANRLEGQSGRLGLGDIDLFVFFDPKPYLHFFGDFAFDRVFDIDTVGGAQATSSDTSVERLYGDLNLSDRANFRFGRFLTPVGLWNQVPAEPLVWTTSRPVVTDEPFDQQVTGAAFWGSFFPSAGSVTYTLYGQFLPALPTAARAPESADNSAGVRLEFAALQGWSVGGSYFGFSNNGRWNDLGGFDVLWRNDRVELTSEFLAGHGEPDGKRIIGMYLQEAVRLFGSVYAVGRYEYYDPGPNDPAVDLYDLGLAWRPFPLLILKADYLLANHSSTSAAPGFYSSLSLLF
jgi:hypothetical protein